MGPWNEVVQNIKGIFQNRAHDGTSEPQDESLYFEKVIQLAPSSPLTSWLWSLHVLSELTRLRRASSVSEMW